MTLKQLNRKCCGFASKMKLRLGRQQIATEQVMALSRIRDQGRKRICRITGDRKLCARMASLGFYPGGEVELLCSGNGSQCILKSQGGTISLDTTASNNIYVESIE